jgi:hypothetical protein
MRVPPAIGAADIIAADEGGPMERSWSVRITDMAHYMEPDGEGNVEGFPSWEAAVAYARRRVWDSVEELRSPGISAADLRRLWWIYGEDASVVSGDYSGSSELDEFIARKARPEDRDFAALAPSPGKK